MNYRFRIFGPFTVPTSYYRKKKYVDVNEARASVFAQAEIAVRDAFDIKKAIGCYVFGLSPPGGPIQWPYYVGKACDQSLHTRVFQTGDKPRIYSDIVNVYRKARPFIYLLPLLTPSGQRAKLGSNRDRINIAEKELIGMALRINKDLWNVQHRTALESFQIEGITTGGKLTVAAKEFRKLLGQAPRSKETVAPVMIDTEESKAQGGPPLEIQA